MCFASADPRGKMTTEYHKIETLYERDEKTFKVKVGELRNRTYSLLKTWHWTEKVDGTNIRCIWRDGKLSFGGKTDNASIPADLVTWLYENVTLDKLRETFPLLLADPFPPDVVIYGEGYGAGIQKGSDYSPIKKLIVFDVLISGKWWLNYENVADIAKKLGLDVIPSFGELTLEDATELVRTGVPSRCALKPRLAEGLVGRPLETLFDKKGHRLITKLKTKDFP